MRKTILAVLVGGALFDGAHGIALAAQAPAQTVTCVPPAAIKVFPVAHVNFTQHMNGASVKIASGLVAPEDILFLQYFGGAGISHSYNSATGTLTISGVATGVEYGNILKSVFYKNGAANPKSGSRVVEAKLTPVGTPPGPTQFFDRFSTTVRVK